MQNERNWRINEKYFFVSKESILCKTTFQTERVNGKHQFRFDLAHCSLLNLCNRAKHVYIDFKASDKLSKILELKWMYCVYVPVGCYSSLKGIERMRFLLSERLLIYPIYLFLVTFLKDFLALYF